MRSQDSSGQSGVLVLLEVLFTIILAGPDNTIVSTIMPVALPELDGAHMYGWTFAPYMLGRGRIDADLRTGLRRPEPRIRSSHVQ